jgi:predicted RND superfamily exporter protein
LIIASLASLTIALIIINVLALVPYNGWQLGSSESVGVVACIGFAVDYVVHLGGHYAHSKYLDRPNRIRESLKEMGISIISGSITTVLSVSVLFFTVILIFSKFAILVISTIVLSTFYSLCFFSACCYVIGPNGDYGSVRVLFKIDWINNIIFRKAGEKIKK